MLNKRGISDVVDNVLLILIGIGLIVIFVFYIFPIIRQPAFSPQDSCLNAGINNAFEIKNACFNKETGDLEVALSRKIDNLNINSLVFGFSNNNEVEKSFTCGNSCGGCIILDKGDIKTYYFSYNMMKKVKLYANNCFISERIIDNC